MLRRIEIKAFKSLDDVSIDLGLINVFVGGNGSGKSNLLEALGVLGAAAAGRVDDESLLRRGVRPGIPALYKTSFSGSRIRDAIRFKAFADQAEFAVELNNPTRRPLPAWVFKTETLHSRDQKIVGRSPASIEYLALNPHAGLSALEVAKLALDDPAARLLGALRDFAIYSPNTPALRGTVSDPQTREPVGLHGGRLAEAVGQLRARARRDEYFGDVEDDLLELIDWISAFGSRRSGEVPLAPSIPTQQKVIYFRDRFMADKRNELSGYDASEGALYVLFAAVLATLPEAPPVLAVDNVDAGLNPRLVRSLMERMCQWVVNREAPRQLLLTCHNPMVLDGLPLQDDRVRLFAVDRATSGKTVVRRVVVDSDLLRKAQEEEYQARRRQLTEAWQDVVEGCTSAAQFNEQLDAILS